MNIVEEAIAIANKHFLLQSDWERLEYLKNEMEYEQFTEYLNGVFSKDIK